MNASIAADSPRESQSRLREKILGDMRDWLDHMDRILDLYRSNFVFRKPSSEELGEHKVMLKESIRFSLFLHTLVADPDFNEPDLADRIQVRIRQLKDAYDTFHDATLSDEQAEKILKHAFPE